MAKDFQTQYNTKTASPASQDYYLDKVLGFLKGNIKKNSLPKELQGSAESLNRELLQIKDKFANLLPAGDLKNFMLNNVKTYMRQSFGVFTNPNYQPDKKVFDGAANYIAKNVVDKN